MITTPKAPKFIKLDDDSSAIVFEHMGHRSPSAYDVQLQRRYGRPVLLGAIDYQDGWIITHQGKDQLPAGESLTYGTANDAADYLQQQWSDRRYREVRQALAA